jgi:hypothetical protein
MNSIQSQMPSRSHVKRPLIGDPFNVTSKIFDDIKFEEIFRKPDASVGEPKSWASNKTSYYGG